MKGLIKIDSILGQTATMTYLDNPLFIIFFVLIFKFCMKYYQIIITIGMIYYD